MMTELMFIAQNMNGSMLVLMLFLLCKWNLCMSGLIHLPFFIPVSEVLLQLIVFVIIRCCILTFKTNARHTFIRCVTECHILIVKNSKLLVLCLNIDVISEF